MKHLYTTLALPCLLTAVGSADGFTVFSMDFVEIGDAGDADDIHGAGYGELGGFVVGDGSRGGGAGVLPAVHRGA